MLINGTPVETYLMDEIPVYVKREDLCCPLGPPFSKTRGVYAHIANLKADTVGVLDTYHSQGGWAVSYIGRHLGKRVVNYWPKYMADREGCLRPQQQAAQNEEATLVPLQAGRSAILYHRAKKHLAENYPGAYMMPNALKLPESVTENALELKRTFIHLPEQMHYIISISSGTVAAGIIAGLIENEIPYHSVVLHLGYSRSHDAVRHYINKMSKVRVDWSKITIVDEQFQYSDYVSIDAPFPCNKYYDLKAWDWLKRNVSHFKEPIMFWNIGA